MPSVIYSSQHTTVIIFRDANKMMVTYHHLHSNEKMNRTQGEKKQLYDESIVVAVIGEYICLSLTQ